MKNYKLTIFCYAAIIIVTACSNSTASSTEKSNAEKETEKITLDAIAPKGNTYLTAEIDGKTFAATTEVAAIEVADKWVIGGENDDFAVSFELPKNVTIGSKMVEAIVVVKKPSSKMYHADLAAATILKTDENAISGTFTFLAKTASEELLEVKNGKFFVTKLKK
jgi:hypothetical protein